jgi:hypothetical protein
MDALAKAGLIDTTTRRNLLTNRLVLIIPKNSTLKISDFRSLTNSNVQRIAVGEPRSVPVGQYSEEVGDDYEELDVEPEEIEDFIEFLKAYKNTLAEANCNCVYEAEYQGREVKLGKPMQGDVKKFKVYVKNPAGNIVKVNFGQKGMKIRKSNPAARKSFRARMNCDNPGPRTKANYWSCRKW